MTVNAGLNLRAEAMYLLLYSFHWIIRDTVIDLGQICACILALYQVSKGAPIGSFVMLISYWGNFTSDPSALIAVATSHCLILYRQACPFRRASAPIYPKSHRR